MKPEKTEHLQRKVWTVGSADEFLDLTPEEATVVKLRLKLADAVKLRRTGAGVDAEASIR